MIQDKINEFCSNVDTRKFERVRNIIKFIPAGFLASDILLSSYYPEIHNTMFYLTLSSTVPCTYLTSGVLSMNRKMLNTDVRELRKIYDEFIKKYNELNKMFNLKDPYELQVLYSYLYKNGYLSKDKEFEFKNRKQKDIPNIYGAEIINGKGVCRHIAAMFSDILNDYGILSSELAVHIYFYYVDAVESKDGDMSKEDLEKWAHENIVDEDNLKVFLWDIKKYEGNGYIATIDDYSRIHLLSRLIGNHAISYANYDGKSYFLDPTQDNFYRRSDKDGSLYNLFNKVDIKGREIYYDSERFKKSIELISSNLPTISKEEEKDIKYRTNKLIEENTDIFEHFYEENKELYGDISSKLLKLK